LPGVGSPLLEDHLLKLSRHLAAMTAAVILCVPATRAVADTPETMNGIAAAPSLQSIIQDTGVANRLVAGELLRVLTQEIPAAACHLHHDINAADATANLSDGVAQVGELLAALRNGDIFWGITTAETRRKTIAEIEGLGAAWQPVLAASEALLSDSGDADAMRQAVGMAEILLDQTDRLLATLEGQYSSSAEILRRDVMSIQIAGRMAALNQHMALQACRLVTTGPDSEIAADLAQTALHYENSLRALIFGMEALGIQPPQTVGIAETLAAVEGIWKVNQPDIARVTSGTGLAAEDSELLYYHLTDERVLILDLLYLYQDHSKVH
jgi:hypothetical protein